MRRIYFQLLSLLFILLALPPAARAAQMLIPGGNIVGLELQNDTVTVVSFEEGSQAQAAGMRPGDRLLAIDGQPITCAQDVRSALEHSNGSVELTVVRDNSGGVCGAIPPSPPTAPSWAFICARA